MTAPALPVVGEPLAPLTIEVTRSMIVATALAGEDYQDVHHDPELARLRGAPDVFMNILTSNGLVERFVRAWAGPASRLLGLRIRLGVQNLPGDRMVLTGRVAEVDPVTGAVTVAISGDNARGAHLTGRATVVLR